MEGKKKSYSIKPEKKFYKMVFLLFLAVMIALIYFQLFIIISAPIYFYMDLILIPLFLFLIYVFFIFYYKNPLKIEIRFEESSLFLTIPFRIKQDKPPLQLKVNKIKTILVHQAFSDKILHLKTISMKITFENDYIFSISHVTFNKNTLLFLKMLFKKTELEKKQLEIDLKMDSDFIRILSKVI